MKKMTVKRRVAMIEVQSAGYRDSCLPYPEAIIHKTHEKLPIIANKRNEDLITIIKVGPCFCRFGRLLYSINIVFQNSYDDS